MFIATKKFNCTENESTNLKEWIPKKKNAKIQFIKGVRLYDTSMQIELEQTY